MCTFLSWPHHTASIGTFSSSGLGLNLVRALCQKHKVLISGLPESPWMYPFLNLRDSQIMLSGHQFILPLRTRDIQQGDHHPMALLRVSNHSTFPCLRKRIQPFFGRTTSSMLGTGVGSSMSFGKIFLLIFLF